MNMDIADLSFEYEKGRRILSDISLGISEGESVGIIGANGVGKSTLLKILVGLNEIVSGSVKVGEIELNSYNITEIRKHIGYVFQDSDSQLFMTTAEEDIAFGPRNSGLSMEGALSCAKDTMELIGIGHLAKKQIYKMSGGEKKMVSIASVLSMNPDIMLLDEPTIALDPRNRRRIMEVLNSLYHTKIITTHDLDMVLDCCERTVLMAKGGIIADGPTGEILRNRELLEANGLELPLCMQRSQSPEI